jgi:hypothetical protein
VAHAGADADNFEAEGSDVGRRNPGRAETCLMRCTA